MSRRNSQLPGVWALVVLVSLAGCGAKQEAQRDVAAAPESLAEGERAVKRDEWVSEPFTLDSPMEVQVSASLGSGPSVDVYIMSEADLNKWSTVVSSGQQTEGLEVSQIPALGLEGLAHEFTSAWTLLQPGNYYIVIDNTSYGATAPPALKSDDIATVQFKVEAQSPRE